MTAEKPCCQAARPWLRGRLTKVTGDRYPLAPLTGQDARALSAFVHLLELYACSDDVGRRSALLALHHAVMAMQGSTRHIAKAAIPYVLDWSDEDRLWPEILCARAIAEGDAALEPVVGVDHGRD